MTAQTCSMEERNHAQSWRAQAAFWEVRIKALKDENMRLKTIHSALLGNVDAGRHSCRDEMLHTGDLKQEIKDLKQENKDLKRLKQEDKDLKRLKQENKDLNQKIKRLNQEIKDLKDLEQENRDLKDLKQDTSGLEQEIKDLKNEILLQKMDKNAWDRAKLTVHQEQVKNDVLQRSLADSNNRFEVLQRSFADSKNQVEMLKYSLESAEVEKARAVARAVARADFNSAWNQADDLVLVHRKHQDVGDILEKRISSLASKVRKPVTSDTSPSRSPDRFGSHSSPRPGTPTTPGAGEYRSPLGNRDNRDSSATDSKVTEAGCEAFIEGFSV